MDIQNVAHEQKRNNQTTGFIDTSVDAGTEGVGVLINRSNNSAPDVADVSSETLSGAVAESACAVAAETACAVGAEVACEAVAEGAGSVIGEVIGNIIGGIFDGL